MQEHRRRINTEEKTNVVAAVSGTECIKFPTLVAVLHCTVINAFGGLVILRAIAGNITSYSREIYGQLKSLL